jgi:hypothetical protein
MGQQQILFIVIGMTIVGVAIAIAIVIFNANEHTSQIDAASNEIVSVATLAMGYYKKPKDSGGGGYSFYGFMYPFRSDSVTDGNQTFYTQVGKYTLIAEDKLLSLTVVSKKPNEWQIICVVYPTRYSLSVNDLLAQ